MLYPFSSHFLIIIFFLLQISFTEDCISNIEQSLQNFKYNIFQEILSVLESHQKNATYPDSMSLKVLLDSIPFTPMHRYNKNKEEILNENHNLLALETNIYDLESMLNLLLNGECIYNPRTRTYTQAKHKKN